jgi:hypothetical protein
VGQAMILPEFVLPSRVNQRWHYTGIDSPEQCQNTEHFYAYPDPVEYVYNNRGFRDAEWPVDLKKSIWCIGDSFTVGLGQPWANSWPQLLQSKTNTRTINVSMDGASNDWIARKTLDLLDNVSPDIVVIQWSFIHRREESCYSIKQRLWSTFYNNIKDSSWPDCPDVNSRGALPARIQKEIAELHNNPEFLFSDEDRRLSNVDTTDQQDIENLTLHIQQVDAASAGKVIHSFIPNFAPHSVDTQSILQLAKYSAGEVKQIDHSRDGFHYDLLTADRFVSSVCQFL